MNISSTNNASSTFGKISTANTSNTPNTPIKAPVRTDDPNKTQEQSPKSTATIVIDEQAITLFKEKQTSQLAYSRSNNANYSDVGQDQPTVKKMKQRLLNIKLLITYLNVNLFRNCLVLTC